MVGEIVCVGAGAVDERGLAAAEKLQADHIGPWRFRNDAAVMDDAALAVHDRQVEP